MFVLVEGKDFVFFFFYQ